MKYLKVFESFKNDDFQQDINDIFLPFMDYGDGDIQVIKSDGKFNRLDKKIVTDHNLLTKEVFSGMHLSIDGEFKINKESLLELNYSIKSFENYANCTLDSIFCRLDAKVIAISKARYIWFNSVNSIEEYLQEKKLDSTDLYFKNFSLAFCTNNI